MATTSEYSLLLKHTGNSTDKYTHGLVGNLGFVVLEIPMVSNGEVKELAKNDWPDEQGEDVYIPSQLLFKAGILKIKVGYTNDGDKTKKDCQQALYDLESYLSKGPIMIYSEWIKQGFGNCSYKGCGDVDHFKISNAETITCYIEFYIHDMTNRVTANNF